MLDADPASAERRQATPPSVAAVDALLQDQPTMLSIPQVAALLSTTPPTVRRIVEQGGMRAVRLSRQWRIAREDLRTYLLTPSSIEDTEDTED